MVCDSTNVFNPAASGSEADVREGLDKLIGERAHGRVLVTTFASNAARLHTLGQVAADTGRRICVAGRSMDRILKVARATGYLRDFPEPVRWEDAMRMKPHEVLIVCTGAQGEPNAALSRIAEGQHPVLKLDRGDMVVYSSRQIPGNDLAIGRVQNKLAALGVEVITDSQAHVHVSGHPGRPELEAMYGWIKPKIAVPVHGERRHLEAHAKLAKACGVTSTVVPVDGAAIRLAPGKPQVIGHEKVGRLVLDGDVILPADGATMNARRKIMANGYLSATIVLNGGGRLATEPRITAHGLPVEEDRAAFVADCVKAVSGPGRSGDVEGVRTALRRVARTWTGKRPVTDVEVIRHLSQQDWRRAATD